MKCMKKQCKEVRISKNDKSTGAKAHQLQCGRCGMLHSYAWQHCCSKHTSVIVTPAQTLPCSTFASGMQVDLLPTQCICSTTAIQTHELPIMHLSSSSFGFGFVLPNLHATIDHLANCLQINRSCVSTHCWAVSAGAGYYKRNITRQLQ